MELLLLLDRMDSSFDRMDAHMDARIEKSTNELKGYVDLKVGALGTGVKDIVAKQDKLAEKQEEMGKAVGALDGKVDALGMGVKDIAAKEEETSKAVVRAEALGAALALMGGALGAFLSNAPQIKAFWSSV